MRIAFAVVLGTACLAMGLCAQTIPAAPLLTSLEVTLAYSADYTDSLVGGCGCFWMKGGKAEASAYFGRGMSVVAELTGEHVADFDGAGHDLGLVSYLFGPRYTWLNRTRLRPFGQFLVGGVHGVGGLFPLANGGLGNPDGFALASGGGLNLVANKHFAWRAFQADYFQSDLPNTASNREDHLRLSAGVVFRFR